MSLSTRRSHTGRSFEQNRVVSSPFLEHQADLGNSLDVFKRVTANRNDVGVLAFLNSADIARKAEYMARSAGRCLDGFQGGEARLHQIFELLRDASISGSRSYGDGNSCLLGS